MSFPRNSAFNEDLPIVTRKQRREDAREERIRGERLRAQGVENTTEVESKILEAWYTELDSISLVLADPVRRVAGVQTDLRQRTEDLRDAIYNYLR